MEMVADSQHFEMFFVKSMVEPPKTTTGALWMVGVLVCCVSPWPLHLGGILQHDFQPRWQHGHDIPRYTNMTTIPTCDYDIYIYIHPIWVNIFQ